MMLIVWCILSEVTTIMTTTKMTNMPTCTSVKGVGRILRDTGLTTSSGQNINGAPMDNIGRDALIIIGDIMATGDIMVTGGMGGNHYVPTWPLMVFG